MELVEIALASPLNFNYPLRTARLPREPNLAARRRHKNLRKLIKNTDFSHSFDFCDDTERYDRYFCYRQEVYARC